MTAPAHEQTVHVSLGSRSYEIVIVSGQLESFAQYLNRRIEQIPNREKIADKALVVTDANVAATYATRVHKSLAEAGWTCQQVELEPGEPTKCLAVASQLYDRLVQFKADRQTVVVAVGGGVVGDAAGFVAATYARGIGFVQVPTSLLADVDSSIGGKVAVNHPKAKNMIGAFYQPLLVFIDTSALDTLPEREYRSGLAEVIKYGVILDAEFFEFLESNIDALGRRVPDVLRHIITHSCRLKADVVEQDEHEITGLRSVLNYGHTFAHAFEALCGYGELLHGEAVAIGMVYASRLAESMKLINPSITDRQVALLKAVNLPTKLPETTSISADDILDRMKLDKKTIGGQIRLVLPTQLGHVQLIQDIADDDVRAILADG